MAKGSHTYLAQLYGDTGEGFANSYMLVSTTDGSISTIRPRTRGSHHEWEVLSVEPTCAKPELAVTGWNYLIHRSTPD